MLTTLFLGVSQSLPKTSSIKMIEYWLMCNMLIVFVEFLIQTYLVKIIEFRLLHYKNCIQENLENELTNIKSTAVKQNVIYPVTDHERITRLKRKLEKKHSFWNFFSIVMVPTIAIFFMVLYWIFGLIFYYQLTFL